MHRTLPRVVGILLSLISKQYQFDHCEQNLLPRTSWSIMVAAHRRTPPRVVGIVLSFIKSQPAAVRRCINPSFACSLLSPLVWPDQNIEFRIYRIKHHTSSPHLVARYFLCLFDQINNSKYRIQKTTLHISPWCPDGGTDYRLQSSYIYKQNIFVGLNNVKQYCGHEGCF